MLRRGLFREGLVTRWREFEADQPLAGKAVAIGVRGGKLPAARRLQCKIGEVFAWTGGIERSFRDASRGSHLNSNGHADGTPNGGASFPGDFGQNLLENVTARRR